MALGRSPRLRGRCVAWAPLAPPSSLDAVQTVEMCPAIFLSFGRRNWVSNNSCCHAEPTAAKKSRAKLSDGARQGIPVTSKDQGQRGEKKEESCSYYFPRLTRLGSKCNSKSKMIKEYWDCLGPRPRRGPAAVCLAANLTAIATIRLWPCSPSPSLSFLPLRLVMLLLRGSVSPSVSLLALDAFLCRHRLQV